MNILMINYEYPPLGGGGGVFTRDLAEEFANSEHSVDVITSSFRGLKSRETTGGVNIHRVPVLGRTSLDAATMSSLLSFPIPAVAAGAGLLRVKKYDIIHSFFAVPSAPAGVILSRISDIPHVLTVFGGDIYDPTKKLSPHRHAMFRWAVRAALNSSVKVTTESADIAAHAARIYRPYREINVVPIGLPRVHFSPVPREELSMHEDAIYLVSIGRMVKRKGFEYLIKALAILAKKGIDLRLVLIGDGPERGALEALAAGENVSDKVLFAGRVNDEAKFRYLSASDIYALPSIHEGFGIVLLEAMSCGLAVVATDRGGQTEIIKNGRNGTLVPPADAEALASAIEAFAVSEDARQRTGENNLEDVRQYDMSAIADRYLELYSTV